MFSTAQTTACFSAIVLLISSCNPLAPTPQPPQLGLEEKRAQQKIETETIPKFEAEMRSACPAAQTKIAIDWASFDADAFRNFSATPSSDPYNRALGSTIVALQNICRDNLGKQAIAEKLKTLRVVHIKDLAAGRSQLNNGVLTIETDINQSTPPGISQVQQLLEKGL
jgi:hypothetical protein